jgi:hypothetical protein
MKANLSLYMYLALFVVIGIILIVFVMSSLNVLASEQAVAQELALTLSVNIDAMSTVDEGYANFDTGSYSYNIAIEKNDGYYVAVYSNRTLEEGKVSKPIKSLIRSYDASGSYTSRFNNVNRICIEKKPGSLAKVVSCEG